MDPAAALVADIHAEIAEPAFGGIAAQDVGAGLVDDAVERQLVEAEEAALPCRAVAELAAIDDVALAARVVVIDRIDEADGSRQACGSRRCAASMSGLPPEPRAKAGSA